MKNLAQNIRRLIPAILVTTAGLCAGVATNVGAFTAPTISIGASQTTARVGRSVQLTAKTDRAVIEVRIYDQTAGKYVKRCSSTTRCTATVVQNTSTKHSYVGQAYYSAYEREFLKSSSPIQVAWRR